MNVMADWFKILVSVLGFFRAVEGPWQLDRVLGDMLKNGSISGC